MQKIVIVFSVIIFIIFSTYIRNSAEKSKKQEIEEYSQLRMKPDEMKMSNVSVQIAARSCGIGIVWEFNAKKYI